MPELGKSALRRERRHGVAIIYVTVMVIAMLGIVSLAVDFGRVVTAKSEMQRAVDAAARAGAAALMPGSGITPANAAINVAAQNKVDAEGAIVLQKSDVLTGNWNESHAAGVDGFTQGGTPLNAVRVTASLTSAKGNAIPLWFGMALGAKSCQVDVVATAMLHTSTWDPSSLTGGIVSAKGNVFLAGQTDVNTQASVPMDPIKAYKNGVNVSGSNGRPDTEHPYEYDLSGKNDPPPSIVPGANYDPTKINESYMQKASDGQLYENPAQVGFSMVPGASLTITSVSGLAINTVSGKPSYDANGSNGGKFAYYQDVGATDTSAPAYTGQSNTGTATINGTKYNSIVGSENSIANIDAPLNSLLGVFLDDNNPNNDPKNPIPPGMDFTSTNAQDYKELLPQQRQPFFIGDGTSGSANKSIIVPKNATRMFLGTMDGQEWSNNQGGFTMVITQRWITLVK